jgi:hypothetical protein
VELNKSFHIYGLIPSIMKIKRILVIAFLLIIQTAQAEGDVSPDYMRSIGKIYVVAAVCLVILLTLLIYMVLLDRKISRLENRQKNE